MLPRMTVSEIHEYWSKLAKEHGLSSDASWSDRPVIEMEIREVLKWLEDGDSVLDVGCANGYSTLQFAIQKLIHIRGVDYVPEMIESANLCLSQSSHELTDRVAFAVGDITALAEPEQAYNRVIVIRVLINLGEWSEQYKGLQECIRVLKKGGMLLLSEATLQGWNKLNLFRKEWELPPIPMPPFNNYLDEAAVVEACSDQLELVEISDFASTYYIGTRLIKPLLIKALGADVDVANPNMEWNRWFSKLQPAGDYGTQKLFVFRKRA